MRVIEKPEEMQAWAVETKRAGVRLGLVPTMGYLHEGHLSLVRLARERCGAVVLSLFVNPTQFGPGEDFNAYPRAVERDIELCRSAGVDVVFFPQAAVMYAPDASVTVVEEQLSAGLCGASRPGHFRGVCTVVAKLFNIALPDVAVFGQKDYQQVAVIRRMVRDLNVPVEIVVAPILRDPDGLAMSSRNAYLSPDERRMGLGLSQSLALARDAATAGERDADVVIARMRAHLESRGLRVDYVAVVHADTLEPVAALAHGQVALVAAFAGKTRLIDNAAL
ncbi:MAG: pantoate--beta-alanine ligase [Lentisphaerae bacterium]|nr:pantoate--beta-alanine ligase [Lentisphaerota bacterium]